MKKTETETETLYVIDTYTDKLKHSIKSNLINIETGKVIYKPNGPINEWFDDVRLGYGNKNFKCAQVRISLKSSKGWKDYYNYIDYNGNILYKPSELKKWFMGASIFNNDNVARVLCYNNGNDNSNLIDTKGNILYKSNEPKKWPITIYDFDKHGLAKAYMYNNKYNLINTKGELLYKPNKPNEWFDDIEKSREDQFKDKYYDVIIINRKYKLDRKGNLYEIHEYLQDKKVIKKLTKIK